MSGRGVGMDVLNSTMKDLRGHISIDSQWGRGCNVLLSIPVTLAFLDCLVMRLGNRLFATPVDVVAGIFQPGREQILEIPAEDGGEMVRVRDTYVPICRLPHFYGEETAESHPARTLHRDRLQHHLGAHRPAGGRDAEPAAGGHEALDRPA